MGDSRWRQGRLTRYGPTTSTLCRPGVSRTIVASPLPFLARVMTVFVVASFVFVLAGASFAPAGPCVVSPEGCFLSCSSAFRNATSGASFEKPPSAVGLCGSAHPVRARRSSPPCSSSCSPLLYHREEGGNAVAAAPSMLELGQSDPRSKEGQNGFVGFSRRARDQWTPPPWKTPFSARQHGISITETWPIGPTNYLLNNRKRWEAVEVLPSPRPSWQVASFKSLGKA